MASYLYKSSTGSNWDDDDEDFSAEIYETVAAHFPAPITEESSPHQRALEVKVEVEVDSSPAPVPQNLTHNYNKLDPFECPSFVWATAALWDADHQRRPAYVELTDEDKYGSHCKRINYSANWMHIKADLRCNMKLTMMVKPSPLQLSSTWENDSEGEYIKEAGFLPPALISPELFNGSHSSSEQDEACTPPGSPPEVLFGQWKDKVEEYDPETSAIDVLSNNLEAVEFGCSHEFADFNHISETLDIEDILGDAARNMLQSYINEPSDCDSQTSHDELEEALIPAEATWEEEFDAVEDIGHEQADKQTERETGKPVSNLSSGDIASYTPYGSPSKSSFDEGGVYRDSPAPLTTVDDDGNRRDHIVDLMTVKAMAHELIAIVRNTQINTDPEKTISEEAPATAIGAKSGVVDERLDIHNSARKTIGFVKDAQAAAAPEETTTEAAQGIASDSNTGVDDGAVGYKQPQDDIQYSTHVSECSAPPLTAISLSPDLKYISEPTETSLAWDTVATSWFALSSVPWGRIAVAAAGALIDVVACVARR
ncbi:hypothetical protein EJ07DRAFT_183983 [Lizonia empirigonia]|nr:hypothetical protein EJ07DRAFT_183983 [Lizonia empirigonia]